MRIGIYSPYLDTAGGGEKYILTIAEYLSGKGEKVEILLDNHLLKFDIKAILEKTENLHGLNLSKVSSIEAPIGAKFDFLKKLVFLKKYDWLFFNSDGSIFFSTAKNSVIHLQLPVINPSNNNLWGRIKQNSWREIIYNSNFTKELIEKNWKIPNRVVYPPVSVNEFFPLKKKKHIISVGRFASHSRVKKHTLLIEVFKKFCEDKNFSDWSLHLVGGAGDSDKSYLKELRATIKGSNIFLYPNLPFQQLISLYGQSSIYWHGMGFEETDPKKFEHFGITTVEAMASGCIPIVINLGGQREIVANNISGFLWNNVDELLNLTKKVSSDPKLFKRLSQNALIRSKIFSKENFCKQIEEIVYG